MKCAKNWFDAILRGHVIKQSICAFWQHK